MDRLNALDEPLVIDDIDGLREAIEQVQDAEDGSAFVQCDDRVMDYKAYWNDKTESVRIAAVAESEFVDYVEGRR